MLYLDCSSLAPTNYETLNSGLYPLRFLRLFHRAYSDQCRCVGWNNHDAGWTNGGHWPKLAHRTSVTLAKSYVLTNPSQYCTTIQNYVNNIATVMTICYSMRT
jgi:hypothetical protein